MLKKKVVITLLILISLFVTFSKKTLANPTTSIFVSPSTKTVDVDDTFSIDVKISDVTNLTCWEFKLYFNNAVLNCTDAAEGPFLKSGGSTFWQETIDNPGGKVHLASTLLGLTSVNGSGFLATVTFKAIASGDSTLHLADTKLGDEHIPPLPISHNTVDGNVTVTGGQLPGDANGDCKVDWKDLLIFAMAYGSSEGEPAYVPEADFNSDGKIDWKDLLVLARNYGTTC